MAGRLCFDMWLSVCPRGVPWPGLARGGTPCPGGTLSLLGGVPTLGTPSQTWLGGIPHPCWWGTPARSDRGGGTPWQGWGTPHPPKEEYPLPRTGQQMEYLIRRGRCASCVHAGGLSCSILNWQNIAVLLTCGLNIFLLPIMYLFFQAQNSYQLSDRLIRAISNWGISREDDDIEDLLNQVCDYLLIPWKLMIHCSCMK